MQLAAKKREVFGKKTKELRRNRQIPGVVFGQKSDSFSITLQTNDFIKVYDKVGETNLIELKIDGDTRNVLVKSVQKHPVSSEILHVDLYEVNLKEKVTASIPVEIVGDEDIELVKAGEALPLVLLNEIDVEALPTDLPDKFVVDISSLKDVDDAISISQLNYDRTKIEILDQEEDALVVKLGHAGQEEIEEHNVSEEELLANIEATKESEESDDSNKDEDSEE